MQSTLLRTDGANALIREPSYKVTLLQNGCNKAWLNVPCSLNDTFVDLLGQGGLKTLHRKSVQETAAILAQAERKILDRSFADAKGCAKHVFSKLRVYAALYDDGMWSVESNEDNETVAQV